MVIDLGVTYTQLNRAMSVNYVGLAMGCVFFVPLAKKYGRRPIYLISTAIMLATSFWSAGIHSLSELYITNLLQGLAGATNESIVQITIADLFFVHHRGGMNGLYMTMVMIGTFLTPMAAGTQATRQSWRWSYRTLGIANAVIFALFLVFYEETKYTKVVEGEAADEPESSNPNAGTDDSKDDSKNDLKAPECTVEASAEYHEIDHNIPMKPLRERLAFITYTPGSVWPSYYRPFIILFTFPAVLFSALQYAAGVVWLTILSNVLALVLPLPPYSFTSEQVGYMSVGPFIGNLLGSIYGGYIGDRSILNYARRNKGFYEPEMRLYILHLPALTMCGGIIMFGVTLSKGMHWILPSIGGALFGFGLGGISDAALTLVIDSYRDITGDAFTGVAFLRNAFSIGIPFAISPWMQRNGLANMFITCGFMSLGVTGLMIPMILFGKRMRARLATRYAIMAAKGMDG
ncbi:hypothetical protein AWENTII_012685 [Aspergillus wentii]